jgi:hypothetical protein
MDKELVENYFAGNGPVDREADVPNWLEKGEDGKYELVRLDNQEIVHRFGFFIEIKAKEVLSYEEGKGKAIAIWNYSVSVPSGDERFAFQLYSDDSLKYVFAYPDGTISAIPPRMRQMQNQLSTLRLRNVVGDIPLMPYVNLAWWMWTEDNWGGAAKPTIEWLKANMEGFRVAFA